jgi:hypothetical protein
MSRASSPKLALDGAWTDLYMAALFERDIAKLSARIALAQYAIEAQRRRLFFGDNVQELRSLDNAMLSLQALATCLLTTLTTV